MLFFRENGNKTHTKHQFKFLNAHNKEGWSMEKIGGRRHRRKQRITYLNSLSKWIAKQVLGAITKKRSFSRANKGRKTVESHDHLVSEGTQHVKMCMFCTLLCVFLYRHILFLFTHGVCAYTYVTTCLSINLYSYAWLKIYMQVLMFRICTRHDL